MIEFICATYNEIHEIDDLINHIYPYVDRLIFVDDESVDGTARRIEDHQLLGDPEKKIFFKKIPHSGLPEYVKNKALIETGRNSWILMLDADERFAPGVLESIRSFYKSPEAEEIDYVYFNQLEVMDKVIVRNFQKSKLFKKDAIEFQTENIHADDILQGRGLYKEEWVVYHRKSSKKQRQREIEYLRTYDNLFDEGKIDDGRRKWLRGLHYFEKGNVPHG